MTIATSERVRLEMEAKFCASENLREYQSLSSGLMGVPHDA